MSTTIPYSPSLVLGSIIEPAAIDTLLAVSAAQTPIDAAQETLNSFIAMKRSLEMTVQELINMKIDPKDLVKKVQEVGADVDKAATAYATTRLEQELKLQPLRAKMQMVNASVESPIDYNRTQIKTLPLAADSLKLDAQFFTFDDNQENDNNTLSNIKSYVSGATSFLGIDTSFDMAKTAVDQVDKQRQLHKISGTLVLTATCRRGHPRAHPAHGATGSPDTGLRARRMGASLQCQVPTAAAPHSAGCRAGHEWCGHGAPCGAACMPRQSSAACISSAGVCGQVQRGLRAVAGSRHPGEPDALP